MEMYTKSIESGLQWMCYEWITTRSASAYQPPAYRLYKLFINSL